MVKTLKLLLLIFLSLLNCTVETTIKTCQSTCGKVKYQNIFANTFPIDSFFDLEQGKCCAKNSQKPILLIFGAWAGVYFDKMNANIFSDKEIKNYIEKNFITVCLLVDDLTELPLNEQIQSLWESKIRTLGNRNTNLQVQLFQTGSQPSIGILDTQGNLISDLMSYTPDKEKFLNWLKVEVSSIHH